MLICCWTHRGSTWGFLQLWLSVSHEPFSLFHHGVLIWLVFLHDDTLHKLDGLHARLPFLVLQQQQDLGRRIGTSKMHLSPPPPPPPWLRLLSVLRRWFCCCWLLVNLIVGVCNCSMFCCTLLCVHSSIAIILMGKRELVALLNLSSWCLVMVERLFLAVPRGCLRFVTMVFPDHTHYFWPCHMEVKVNPRVIICTYFVENTTPMLHTRARNHWPFVSGEGCFIAFTRFGHGRHYCYVLWTESSL